MEAVMIIVMIIQVIIIVMIVQVLVVIIWMLLFWGALTKITNKWLSFTLWVFTPVVTCGLHLPSEKNNKQTAKRNVDILQPYTRVFLILVITRRSINRLDYVVKRTNDDIYTSIYEGNKEYN